MFVCDEKIRFCSPENDLLEFGIKLAFWYTIQYRVERFADCIFPLFAFNVQWQINWFKTLFGV